MFRDEEAICYMDISTEDGLKASVQTKVREMAVYNLYSITLSPWVPNIQDI